MRIPIRFRPLLILGVIGIPLESPMSATVRAQEPSSEPPALARYVPKDNVVVYLEYQGLDAQADAWKKTAAYKILNSTPTGAMLEDVATQLLEKLGAKNQSHPRLWAEQSMAVIKHAVRSGFVWSIISNPDDRKQDASVLVLRGAFKDKNIRTIVAGYLRDLNAPNTQPKSVVRAGHKVVTGVLKDGEGFAWWVEDSKKEDIIRVLGKVEQADAILETLDGKRPSVVTHPGRTELLKPDGRFAVAGVAFLAIDAIRKNEAFEKDYGYLGLGNITSIDLRWGFEDEALMTHARIGTSGPRQGLLAFPGTSTFDKSKLPSIPPGVAGFTAVSVDMAGELDRLKTEMKRMNPDADAMINKYVDLVKEKTKLRLKEDLLAHLGPKMAWYVLPAKKAATGAAGLAGMMGAGIEVPRFAVVIDLDNPTTFGKVLDQAMQALNRELKTMGKPAADQPAKGARTKAAATASGNSFEFRTNPGESKSYTLQIPPEFAAQIPPTLRPTIRLGPKQVVIAVSPEVARAVLESKGTWTPGADLAAAYQALPGNLKMISVSDPREVWPALLATLPGKIQQIAAMASMARMAQPPGANPAQPPPAPAPLVLQVDAAKLPSADAIKALMFPSLLTVETTAEEIRISSRDAFPPFLDPSAAGIATALLLPAVQAARDAARKAAARNQNVQPDGFFDVPARPPAQPGPVQPGPIRPGSSSQPDRSAPGRSGVSPQ